MSESLVRLWPERLAFASLVTLAFLLPFELRSGWPLVSLIEITNVEALLYATILLWVIARTHLMAAAGYDMNRGAAPNGRWVWTPIHAAVAGWVVVLLGTAVLAETGRAEALKFALRGTGGCLLFFVVADLAASERRVATLSRTLALGATISALAGLAEAWMPGMLRALAPFKTQPSVIAGFLRASGTFQYANTAAMYWEAALALVLTVGIVPADIGRRARWLSVAASFVLIEAVLLSLSRAAWSSMAFVLLALGWLSWRRGRRLSGAAAAAIMAFLMLTLVDASGSGLLSRRLRGDEPSVWYQATYRSVPSSTTLRAGQVVTVPVQVENAGVLGWPSSGRTAVSLSYHWYDRTGRRLLAYDGARTGLPRDVTPGEELRVDARVFGALPPGHYVIEWDLVHEAVTWFGVLGAATPRTIVTITEGVPVSSLPRLPTPPRIDIPVRPSRLQLWSAGLRLWRDRPIAGIGPDNFRRTYGPLLGLRRFDDRVQASSLYVEVLVGQGLLGLAALLWLILTFWTASRRAWRKTSSSTWDLLATGIPVALGAFLAHGVVDYFLPFTPTYGLFWMLGGLTASLGYMIPGGATAGRAEAPRAR